MQITNFDLSSWNPHHILTADEIRGLSWDSEDLIESNDNSTLSVKMEPWSDLSYPTLRYLYMVKPFEDNPLSILIFILGNPAVCSILKGSMASEYHIVKAMENDVSWCAKGLIANGSLVLVNNNQTSQCHDDTTIPGVICVGPFPSETALGSAFLLPETPIPLDVTFMDPYGNGVSATPPNSTVAPADPPSTLPPPASFALQRYFYDNSVVRSTQIISSEYTNNYCWSSMPSNYTSLQPVYLGPSGFNDSITCGMCVKTTYFDGTSSYGVVAGQCNHSTCVNDENVLAVVSDITIQSWKAVPCGLTNIHFSTIGSVFNDGEVVSIRLQFAYMRVPIATVSVFTGTTYKQLTRGTNNEFFNEGFSLHLAGVVVRLTSIFNDVVMFGVAQTQSSLVDSRVQF